MSVQVINREFQPTGIIETLDKQDKTPYYQDRYVDELLRAEPETVSRTMAVRMYLLGYMSGKRAERARRKEIKKMSVQDLIDRYGTSSNIRICNAELPVLHIKMMDDDELRALTVKNAVNNYRRINGRDPETVEEALQWQRGFFAAKASV